MRILLVVVLLLIVIIFGVSSGMQSYATAQQARAQIEVAQVAQVSAWGNLVTIGILALVIGVTLALIAGWLFLVYRRGLRPAQRAGERSLADPRPAPQVSVGDLIQLELLRTLREMRGRPESPAPPAAPREEEQEDDILAWLR